ncbi:MAG: hypothetical protein HW386_253 [Gammaproteobacteria bacterium]|nr:hypothetical protein [Gammaproteobacteria bacterium]
MAKKKPHTKVRPLTASDLQQVVKIDTRITGHPRPGFFEKRLAAAITEPENFIYIGCEVDGSLKGHLLARLQEGEYGVSTSVAVMDAIGVDPDCMKEGIGRVMMEAFETILRHKQVPEFQTQTEWNNLPLIRFLSAYGFKLAPRQVLEREVSYMDTQMRTDPVKADLTAAGEKNYSDPSNDDAAALARDRITCRSLTAADVSALTRIDRKVTGQDHLKFYQRKVQEVVNESGIRVSLAAEQNGQVIGFIMARVDFGEFGRTEPVAVLDSIAVDPGYRHSQVGSAMLSQLLANLTSLRLEKIRTEVDADHFDVLNFLTKNGFKNSQRLAFSYQIKQERS